MLRAYIVVVERDSSLLDIRTFNDLNRKKAAVTLTEDEFEFFISVEGTDYNFRVLGNIRKVDEDKVSTGLARIGFIKPKLDIVIFCNPGELKAFVYIVQVLQHCRKLKQRQIIRSVCVCKPFWKPINSGDFPVYDIHGVSSLIRRVVYRWCYRVEDHQLGLHNITVTSYPYLQRLTAISHNLAEFPEALGSLPCLSYLNLSANLLGKATNWKWLMSPFIRANLRELYLDANGLFSLPDVVVKLKQLEILSLNMNYLTELPAALGNLKFLSALHIGDNKLKNLPAWMYQEKRFSSLSVGGNDFHCANLSNNAPPQLHPGEFETVTVSSLLEIVARFIINKRLAFWKYNIPCTLTDYLEGMHYCRCGSVVFHDTTVGRVVECCILLETLVDNCDDDDIVPVIVHCCSYKCYRLIEPYIM